jgi:hypothetical protein
MQTNEQLCCEAGGLRTLHEFFTSSKVLRQELKFLRNAPSSNLTILIKGESSTRHFLGEYFLARRSLFSCCRKRAEPPPGMCRRCSAPPDPAKPVPIHFSLQQPRRCSLFSGFTPRFDARVTTDADLVVELPGPGI